MNLRLHSVNIENICLYSNDIDVIKLKCIDSKHYNEKSTLWCIFQCFSKAISLTKILKYYVFPDKISLLGMVVTYICAIQIKQPFCKGQRLTFFYKHPLIQNMTTSSDSKQQQQLAAINQQQQPDPGWLRPESAPRPPSTGSKRSLHTPGRIF